MIALTSLSVSYLSSLLDHTFHESRDCVSCFQSLQLLTHWSGTYLCSTNISVPCSGLKSQDNLLFSQICWMFPVSMLLHMSFFLHEIPFLRLLPEKMVLTPSSNGQGRRFT